MKKLYKKLIGLGFLTLSMMHSASGQTCVENSSVTALDDTNPVVNISSFPCTGGGAITAMTMDAAIGLNCGIGYYSYDVVVNGTPILTNQCDLTAVDLTPYLPITSVEIQGHDDDVYGDLVTLDLTLNITYIPASCPGPNTLSSVPTATSADLEWVEAASATSWQVEWGTMTFAQGTGTLAVTSTNPHNITGLTANTSYDFYVRAICAVGDTSTWAGPFTFTTPCASYNVPWGEGFESISAAGEIPSCIAVTADFTTEIVATTYNRAARTGTDYAYTEWTADDWFFTAGINLTAGTSYDFSTWYNTDGNAGWDTISLWVGTDQMALSMTDSLTAVIEVTNTSYMEIRGTFVPSVSGVYYFGTHVEANVSPWYVSFDDFLVELTPTCDAPFALATTSATATSADLAWVEAGSATQWQIEWDAIGFPQGSGTLAVTSTNPHNITGLTASTNYDFYVRAICGVGDTSAWTGPFTFITPCNTFSVPFFEGFNSASTTQSCWSVLDNDGDVNTWTMDYTTNPFEGDEVAMMYTDFNAGANDDYMITPQITLTGNERLRYSYRVQDAGEPNDFEILLSTTSNSPASFTNVLLVDTSSNITYVERIIDLSAFSGNVYIAFHIPAGGLDGWRLYIDDVNVEAIPSCVDPTILSVTNTTASTADLGWTENGSATSWQIEWDTLGFPQGTGTLAVTSTNPHNLTGLTASTSYDFYVRAICGIGDSSNWVGPFTFITPCNPIVAPWFDDVESHSGTTNSSIANCWSSSPNGTSTVYRWDVSIDGTTPSSSTGPLVANSGSNFFYTEASDGITNDLAELYSPNIDLTALTAPELKFFYHMNGVLMGDLYIDVYNGSSWSLVDSIKGEQQVSQSDLWLDKRVDLTAFSGTIQVRFRAISGGSWEGDISLDDISIDNVTLNDLKILEVTSSASTGCSLSNAETVTIKIKNNGAADQSNFDVGYTLNGAPISPETITATILSGDTLTYTFTTVADMSTPMVYNIDAYTLLAGDQDTSNDTMSYSATHITPSLAFSDSLLVSDNIVGGTHGIICTNGLLPNQLDNCYQLSAIVIDSLTHAYDGDLDIYLIAPSGDTLEISTDNGGSGVDYIGVVFTDTAANNVNSVSAGGFPSGGYYSIEDLNGLGSLNGIDPNGMWDLWITDDAGGDDGMLFAWHLEFTDYSFVVDLGANSSVCAIDDSVTLDAGAGTYSYSWSTTDSTQMITVSESTVTTLTISVLVTDTLSQCTSTDTVDVSFGDCSGVSELSTLDFSIYPNPSNGTFTIAAGEVNNNVSIEVFDMQGRVIFSIEKQISTGSKNTISLGGVEHGIYLVDIVSTSGRFTQTIVVE